MGVLYISSWLIKNYVGKNLYTLTLKVCSAGRKKVSMNLGHGTTFLSLQCTEAKTHESLVLAEHSSALSVSSRGSSINHNSGLLSHDSMGTRQLLKWSQICAVSVLPTE